MAQTASASTIMQTALLPGEVLSSDVRIVNTDNGSWVDKIAAMLYWCTETAFATAACKRVSYYTTSQRA